MKRSKDPLYNWLIDAIRDTFDFLLSDWQFRLTQIEADKSGCSLTYEAPRFQIHISAEKGGRPECCLVVDGHSHVLNAIIKRRWPHNALPPRPEYTGIEGEKVDFSVVLEKYASVLRRHKDELLDWQG